MVVVYNMSPSHVFLRRRSKRATADGYYSANQQISERSMRKILSEKPCSRYWTLDINLHGCELARKYSDRSNIVQFKMEKMNSFRGRLTH